MKACSIFVVSAALFIAKVHAESFTLVEVFSDSACLEVDLKKASYEVEDCTGPDNSEGYEYYSKVTCSSSEKTRSFYTDTACTMDHPNITDNTETLACTSYGGGRYKKITCSAATAQAMVYYRFPDGDNDCSESPISEHKMMPTYLCMANSEFDDGNWTNEWHSRYIENGRVGGRKYTTEDCSDTPTNLGGPSPGNDTWVCGQCTEHVVGEGSTRYAKIQCPPSGVASGAPRDASPGPLLAAAAAALMLMAAGAA